MEMIVLLMRLSEAASNNSLILLAHIVEIEFYEMILLNFCVD